MSSKRSTATCRWSRFLDWTADLKELAAQLDGSIVTLEPLREEHAEELWKAAQAGEIWAWLADLNVRERFDLWIELTLEAAAGREGPFTTRDARTGKAIGSSRYMAVRPADRAVEIGWTWLNPCTWRTGGQHRGEALSSRASCATT